MNKLSLILAVITANFLILPMHGMHSIITLRSMSTRTARIHYHPFCSTAHYNNKVPKKYTFIDLLTPELFYIVSQLSPNDDTVQRLEEVAKKLKYEKRDISEKRTDASPTDLFTKQKINTPEKYPFIDLLTPDFFYYIRNMQLHGDSTQIRLKQLTETLKREKIDLSEKKYIYSMTSLFPYIARLEDNSIIHENCKKIVEKLAEISPLLSEKPYYYQSEKELRLTAEYRNKQRSLTFPINFIKLERLLAKTHNTGYKPCKNMKDYCSYIMKDPSRISIKHLNKHFPIIFPSIVATIMIPIDYLPATIMFPSIWVLCYWAIWSSTLSKVNSELEQQFFFHNLDVQHKVNTEHEIDKFFKLADTLYLEWQKRILKE